MILLLKMGGPKAAQTNYVIAANCHFAPSETNSLPTPVAFVVTPIEPATAVVVVVFAVIAVVRK
jgi:hypothetical protein